MCSKETDAGNDIETYSEEKPGQPSLARVEGNIIDASVAVFRKDRY
jgi:hypothetical protein